jgi:hypothetical protein
MDGYPIIWERLRSLTERNPPKLFNMRLVRLELSRRLQQRIRVKFNIIIPVLKICGEIAQRRGFREDDLLVVASGLVAQLGSHYDGDGMVLCGSDQIGGEGRVVLRLARVDSAYWGCLLGSQRLLARESDL